MTTAPEPSDAFRAVKTMEMDALRDWVQEWQESQNPGGLEPVDDSGNTSIEEGHIPGGARGLREVFERMRDDSPKQSTLLHWASYLGFVEAVHYLLDLGASPFAQESDGKTPLHWACFEGHAPVVQALLKVAHGNISEDGLPVELMRDKLNHTSCHLAIINRHDRVAEMCPNYAQVKGASSISPYRSRSRHPSTSGINAATFTTIPSSNRHHDQGQGVESGVGSSVSGGVAPEGRPPLTPSRLHQGTQSQAIETSVDADSPHELYSVVPVVGRSESMQESLASSDRGESSSQSRWSRRNRSKNHLISPRSTQPPPRIGELKDQAEQEERRPYLEDGGVPAQRRSESSPSRFEDQQQFAETAAYDQQQQELEELRHQESIQQQHHGQQLSQREVSPGGVTYHQQTSAQSYDELPDENDPNLTAEERQILRELQDVQHKKDKAERRRAREDRRAERTDRIQEIRGYIQNWVAHSLSPEAPPPQELLASLENAGIIPNRSQDGTIHWTDTASKRGSRGRSHHSSKSRDFSHSQGSLGEGPIPNGAYPHPQRFQRTATGDSMPNTARTEASEYSSQTGVRIPSTRYPPTTDLYQPRNSHYSARSHSSRKTWKPPNGVPVASLEMPLPNVRVERLQQQDRSAMQLQTRLGGERPPAGRMTPTKQAAGGRGGGFEAASPRGSIAPEPRGNIPQPAGLPPTPMTR